MELSEREQLSSLYVSFETDGSIVLNANVIGTLIDKDGNVIGYKPGSTQISRSIESGTDIADAITKLADHAVYVKAEDKENARAALQRQIEEAEAAATASVAAGIREEAEARARVEELRKLAGEG